VWYDVNGKRHPGFGRTGSLRRSGRSLRVRPVSRHDDLQRRRRILRVRGRHAPGPTTCNSAPGSRISGRPPSPATIRRSNSSVTVTTGSTGYIDTTYGGPFDTYDVGIAPTVAIGDFVWSDLNGNGIQDSGEPGHFRVKVELYPSSWVVASGDDLQRGWRTLPVRRRHARHLLLAIRRRAVVSWDDALRRGRSGARQQRRQHDDSHRLDERNPTRRPAAPSTPMTPASSPRSRSAISCGGIQTTTGIRIRASPEFRVFESIFTGSGSTSSLVTTTYSGQNGHYEFAGVTPGTYYLQFGSEQSYRWTTPHAGDDRALDSDVASTTTVTGWTGAIDTTSGGPFDTYDAGILPTVTIGDSCGTTRTGNGIQDSGELGVSGVSVDLFRSDSSPPFVATTYTGSNGHYQFVASLPGPTTPALRQRAVLSLDDVPRRGQSGPRQRCRHRGVTTISVTGDSDLLGCDGRHRRHGHDSAISCGTT